MNDKFAKIRQFGSGRRRHNDIIIHTTESDSTLISVITTLTSGLQSVFTGYQKLH